jgi:hypothetical protein
MRDDETAKDFMARIDGRFLVSLDRNELGAFHELERRGLARRSYEGVTGLLRLSKARSPRVDATPAEGGSVTSSPRMQFSRGEKEFLAWYFGLSWLVIGILGYVGAHF